MMNRDCSFMIDAATMFFDYVRIAGWFHSATDELVDVYLANPAIGQVQGSVGLAHSGVERDLGPGRGFCIQAIISVSNRTKDLRIIFRTRNGRTIEASLIGLCLERKEAFPGHAMLQGFIETVNSVKGTKLLDIGGRARSGVERRLMFERADCTVLDIMPDESVDVVGDAHSMSKLFAPNSFDAIHSASVFEHLLMPWVVAREMAVVLRLGGVAFISTHQTVGMHDLPWDFWRFSDTAWDGLFNRFTGFEIIGRALDSPQYITPHFWSPEQGDHLERAAGFYGSSVLVRKISEPQPGAEQVELADVITTTYPDTPEPLPPGYKKPRKKFPWNFS